MSDILNDVADHWWHAVVHSTCQATLVALLILAVVKLGSRLPAMFLYMLVLVAMVKFLVPPFIVFPTGLFSHFSPPLAALVADVDRAPVRISSANQPTTTVPPTSIELDVPSIRVETSRTLMPTPNMEDRARVQVAEPPIVGQTFRIGWHACLMLAHLTGTLGIVVWIARQAFQVHCIARQAQHETTSPLSSEFDSLSRRMGISAPTRLLLSSRCITPMVCGLCRPTVIVPAALMKQVSLSDQRAILAHELAHVRGFDLWVIWLQGLMLAAWWWNPVVWLLNRKILRLREECCDDFVILHNVTSREGYCAAMVRAVEWCATRTRIASSLAAHVHPLKSRITRAMDDRISRSPRLSWAAWSCVILMALVMLPGLRVNSVTLLGQDSAAEEGTSAAPSAVVGTVVDEEGIPRQATVWLMVNSDGGPQFESTTTNREGEFRFAGIKEGPVTLTAVPAGQSFCGLHHTVHDGLTGPNLRLATTTPTGLCLRLTDEDGVPVSGAELAWINWKTPESALFWLPLEVLDHQAIPRPTSDADGFLTVPRIPRNVLCNLSIKHADFARALVEKIAPVGSTTEIVLRHGSPITISAITADSREPVPDATVTITGIPESIRIIRESVDKNGELHIRLPVMPEFATVHVHHPYLTTDRWGYLSGGTGSRRVEFELFRKGKARGRVIDAVTGVPLAGVRMGIASKRQIIAYGVSDQLGEYEIEGPVGARTLEILSGNGFFADRYEKTTVHVVAGNTVVADDLKAKRMPPIRGLVEMPDGRPAVGVLVSLQERGSQLTDARGRFEIQIDRHEPGYHITASHMADRFASGFGVLFDDVMLGKEVRIELQSEAEIRGTVITTKGEPLAGIPVVLSATIYKGPEGRTGSHFSHQQQATTMTDRNGGYRFVGLSRHLKYRVGVQHPLSIVYASRTEAIQPDQPVVRLDPIEVSDDDLFEGVTPETPKKARELTCRTWINSLPLSLTSLRGKVVLLDFWATWCGPCVAELPNVQLAHELFKEKGLVVVGLHHRSVPDQDVLEFVRDRGLTYAVGVDTDYGETCGRYGVNSFPTKILIDRDGNIVEGAINRRNLLATLRRLVLYDAR